jgi:hypothetical protein
LAFSPFQSPFGTPLRQNLRCLRDIEPSTSSALFLTLLEILAIEGQVPHFQENRELHLDTAVIAVFGRAQELVGVPCGQPNQRRSRGTTERALKTPLGNAWRTDQHWFLEAVFKQI